MSKKGFAGMDKNVVAAISAEGGRAAHAKGTAHEFTKSEAAAAGRLGGYASAAKRLGMTLEQYMKHRGERQSDAVVDALYKRANGRREES